MRHAHTCGIALALALSVVSTVAGAQPRVGPTAPTSSAPGVPPPPVLEREASRRGGSIAPGYVHHPSPRVGFVIGGAAVFLATYVPMAIIAAEEDQWVLAVPVVGPLVLGGQFLGAAVGDSTCTSGCFVDGLVRVIGGFMGFLLIADGLIQTCGVAVTVLEVARPRQFVRYEPARSGVRWAMTPGAAGTPLGLTLSLTNL